MKSFVKNLRSGFTLIEMVVVMSIVVIMSVALFANYREIGDQGRVTVFTGKVREDLYLAQSYALAGKTTRYGISDGWGINFNRNTNKYTIFSDLDGDKAYSYPTKLLIHGNETVSAGTFTESSHTANTATISGSPAQVNSSWPAGLGTTGYWQFHGPDSIDNFKVTDSANFNYGSGDFTVDMWFWVDVVGGTNYILSQANVLEVYKSTGDLIYFDIYDVDGGLNRLISDPVTASTTYHLALTRKNNLLTLFLNGSVKQTLAMTKAVSNSSNQIYIGTQSNNAWPWRGRIDEVRISKGVSRWQEKFAIPVLVYRPDDELFRAPV